MQTITYIADPEILAIPIIECNEPLIDVKNYTELQYGSPPECPLTAECYTKLRKSVFEKLCQAQADLPKGWRFRLYEGFRSLKVQQLLFEQEYQRMVERYPDWSHPERFREATRLVSPVINLDGSQNIPPHNTGGAVDIEIVDAQGQLINMGMTAEAWSHANPELCLTDCQSIDETAQQNRKCLVETMQAYGFINYPTEWWHFSYGDRYWAYHQEVKRAIYGSADFLFPEIDSQQ